MATLLLLAMLSASPTNDAGASGAASTTVDAGTDGVSPAVLLSLRDHSPKLARCAGLADAGETVQVVFRGDSDGGTQVVEPESPTPLEHCAASAANQLRLPWRAGRHTVSWRFSQGGPELLPLAAGGLAKEVIKEVIERHRSEVRFCYEFVLQQKPTLEGEVKVSWVIGASGQVSSATIAADSMGDPRVSECVVERVKRWRFPEPEGGGIVNVTFPWIFKMQR